MMNNVLDEDQRVVEREQTQHGRLLDFFSLILFSQNRELSQHTLAISIASLDSRGLRTMVRQRQTRSTQLQRAQGSRSISCMVVHSVTSDIRALHILGTNTIRRKHSNTAILF